MYNFLFNMPLEIRLGVVDGAQAVVEALGTSLMCARADIIADDLAGSGDSKEMIEGLVKEHILKIAMEFNTFITRMKAEYGVDLTAALVLTEAAAVMNSITDQSDSMIHDKIAKSEKADRN